MIARRLRTAAVVFGAIALPAVTSADDRALTLNEAVRVALAQNGDLYVAQTDAEIAAAEVEIARSVFDPRLLSEINVAREEQPATAIRFGWRDTRATGAVGLAGRARTGMTYSLNLSTTAQRFTSPFLTVYDPAYTTTLGVSVTQPLLRGAWRKANELPIIAAERRQDAAELLLRVRLQETVGEVVVAYWSLALASKGRQAREVSLKVAHEQLAESTRLARIGTISNLDVTEAQSGVSRMEQELARAQFEVAAAEGELRNVIVGEPTWRPDDILIPADDPQASPIDQTITEQLEIARKNRPDIAAARAEVLAAEAALALAENELRPSLDLVVSGGLIGFAGDLADNYNTRNVVPGTLDPPYMPNASLQGGVFRSFVNMPRGTTVSVGLKLELPLRNSAAKGRHERQRRQLERARIAAQALLTRIENEVKTSLALLRADAKAQRVSQQGVEVNEKLLAGMRNRFAAGEITSFEVLRVADELARAQIQTARAHASYRVSLARLATANGTLLPQLGVDVSSLK